MAPVLCHCAGLSKTVSHPLFALHGLSDPSFFLPIGQQISSANHHRYGSAGSHENCRLQSRCRANRWLS